MDYIRNAAKLYRSGLSLRNIEKIIGVPRETIRIKLISYGTKLRKSKRHMVRYLHASNFNITPISSELLALHAGDGCLDINGNWCFSSNKSDMNHVKNVVNKFEEIVGVSPHVRVRNNRVQIESGTKQTTEYFSRFFPMGKKSSIVYLPIKILNSRNIEIKRSALRGLFSTDGCFSFRNNKELTPRIEFRVMSKKLRDQFVDLAKSFGFSFNFNAQKHHHRGLIYTAYIERINDVIEWMDMIGSGCDTHIKRYKKWLKLRSGSPIAWSRKKHARKLDWLQKPVA